MFCQSCGTQNASDASFCVRCGVALKPAGSPAPPPPHQYPPPQHIENYLVQAILVTIFCCLPFGIAAIVYAAQVNSKLAMGDFNGAMDCSRNAKKWSLVGLIVGVVGLGLYLAVIMIGVLANKF